MSEQAASVSWEVVQKDIASQLRKFGSKDLGLSRGRLILALVGLVSAGISFAGGGTWFAFIAAASAVGFIVLLSWHESVFRCLVLNRRKMAFIERSAKRVRTGVDSDGPEGVELVPADHPAAWDQKYQYGLDRPSRKAKYRCGPNRLWRQLQIIQWVPRRPIP